jgi:hypothetical protein
MELNEHLLIAMGATAVFFNETGEIDSWIPADLDTSETAVLAAKNKLLAAAKAKKKARIESERDAQCEKPVQALGRTWDADKRSQELLASAITIAQAGGPLPVVWRDYDNDNMQVTSIDDLLAIATAIAAQTQTAYTKSWARKEAVDAAQTLDEVEAA